MDRWTDGEICPAIGEAIGSAVGGVYTLSVRGLSN